MAKGFCSTCKEQPSLSYATYCRKCHSKRQSKYHKQTEYKQDKRRVKEIRFLVKQGKEIPCMDCGVQHPWYVMDYDHIRGKKSFNLSISAQRRYGLNKIKEEIAKCDVVCANCHRKRTFNKQPSSITGNAPDSDSGD